MFNTSTTIPAYLTLYADNLTASQSTSTLGREMQFSEFIPLGTAYSGKGIAQLEGEYNTAAILGYRENVDEDLSSLTNNNPTQVSFLHLLAEPVNGSALSVYVFVEMEFYAEFYDLKTVGGS